MPAVRLTTCYVYTTLVPVLIKRALDYIGCTPSGHFPWPECSSLHERRRHRGSHHGGARTEGEGGALHQQNIRTWHPESEGHVREERRDGGSNQEQPSPHRYYITPTERRSTRRRPESCNVTGANDSAMPRTPARHETWDAGSAPDPTEELSVQPEPATAPTVQEINWRRTEDALEQ